MIRGKVGENEHVKTYARFAEDKLQKQLDVLQSQISGARKKVYVMYDSIEAIDRNASVIQMAMKRDDFERYLMKLELLLSLDGNSVNSFDQLEDGGQYRAIQDKDIAQNLWRVSDQALEMEAGSGLITMVNQTYPGAHLHQNVKLIEDGLKNMHGGHQYDNIVHGDKELPTWAVMMEVKSKVHPNDIDLVVKKAEDLRNEIVNHSKFAFTSGHKPEPIINRFSHFRNVDRIIPCLASRHFPTHLVDDCIAKGIMPLLPSGSRFVCGNAIKLSKFLK